ncbi:hypothetical protein LVY75_33410 (plasmid) [Sinorhizobium sp. B11]|jgi:hypothetical protein
MLKLSMRHRTTYSHRFPVQLSPSRLVLRSREGMELLLYTHDIAFPREGRSPTDVFRNAIDYAKPSAVRNIGGRDDRGVGTVINSALRAAGLMR